MKNKLLIVVAAAVAIVLLVIGGMFFLKSSKMPATTQATNTQAAKPQNNSVKGSILSLLSGGKNVSCSITYPDNKGTGTVYVSDKKFAGEFTIKSSDGKEMTGHSVSDGTYVYAWTSATPMGIKMNLADAKNTAQNAGANQSMDINQNVDLKCGPWIPDNSKFSVPSNIEFKDMSQLLKQIQPQVTGTTVAPQTQTGNSPCDQIADPTAKAACANALQGQGY
jgi:hypothetical protein